MDDDELEQVMRAGLERRARRADDGPPALDRVLPVTRRAPRRPWLVGAAAASVVAVVATSVVLTGGSEAPARDVAADSPTRAAQQEWRVERWGDLQVEVPADWGYGAAPDTEQRTCSPEPVLDAAGEPSGGATAPSGYVGRPFVLSDRCRVGGTDEQAATVPYVWLGARVEPGTRDLGDGFLQETVRTGGTTLTVASDDAALRDRVLDSAAGGESCLSEIEYAGDIAHDEAIDPTAEPVVLRVCTYRLDTDDRQLPWRLTSAVDLGPGPLAAYDAAVAAGGTPRDQCPAIDYQLGQAVVLEHLDSDGGVLRQDAVNTFGSCAGVAIGASRVWELETTALTAEMVAPWAVGGTRAVVRGSAALGLLDVED